MSYSITNSSGTTYTVTDGTINNTFDIDLIGRGYVGYGTALNTNFLRMLENFASGTAPTKPTLGQLWYDSVNNTIKVYNGASFVKISGDVPTQYASLEIANLLISSQSITGQLTNTNVNIAANGIGTVVLGKTAIAGLPTGRFLYTASNGTIQATTMQYTPTGDTVTVTSVNATNLAGAITTAAQTQITSVGTLTSLAVSGNVGIGTTSPTVKLDVQGTGAVYGRIASTNSNYAILQLTSGANTAQFETFGTNTYLTNYVSGGTLYLQQVGSGNILAFTNSLERVRIANTGNVGIGNTNPNYTLTVGGNIGFNGNLYQNGNLFRGGVTYTASASAPSSPNTGDQWYNTGNDILYTRANDGVSNFWLDISSLPSTFANVSITGNLNLSGSLTNNIIPFASNTYNLGSSARYFNAVYGVAINAQYADLAELYESDKTYEPGTVVDFGGEFEITEAKPNSKRVAGIISTNPAYLMNSLAQGHFMLPVALQGRVPCKVKGNIAKGDLLVSAGGGYAETNNDAVAGTIVGKALQDFNGNFGIIEVVVGRC